MAEDRAGSAVVVRLVLRQAVDREQVVGEQDDPLLVGQAELVAGVELAVEAEQAEQRVAQEAYFDLEEAEGPWVKRGELQEADGPRVDKAQSSCTGTQQDCLVLQ